MAWIEKVADRLPGWKAALLTMAGQATPVRLSSPPYPCIYWLLSRCQSGLLAQLIRSERVSFGKEERRSMVAVVWLHGRKSLDQSI